MPFLNLNTEVQRTEKHRVRHFGSTSANWRVMSLWTNQIALLCVSLCPLYLCVEV